MKLPGVARRLLDPFTERIAVPVVGGVNAGRWWGVASAGSGYASGRRASTQMRVLEALVQERDVAWDVGAHHGYVTLMMSRRVGATGLVHAFEPSSANSRILRRHLRWNRCANTTVHPLALGVSECETRFGGGDTSKMHALGQGSERVRVRRADRLIAEGLVVAPTFLKVDVEGAEAQFLEGCGSALPPTVRCVIAMHSVEVDRRCTTWLTEHGFAQFPSRALRHSRAGLWRSDPDLFAVGPAGDPEAVRRTLERLDAIDA